MKLQLVGVAMSFFVVVAQATGAAQGEPVAAKPALGEEPLPRETAGAPSTRVLGGRRNTRGKKTCDTFKGCPKNRPLKRRPHKIKCSRRNGCTKWRCCKERGNCGGFECPDNQILLGLPELIPCRGSRCETAECCVPAEPWGCTPSNNFVCRVPPIDCGPTGGEGFCDRTVDGVAFCSAIVNCRGLTACDSDADCDQGTLCARNCCGPGTFCNPVVPDPAVSPVGAGPAALVAPMTMGCGLLNDGTVMTCN